ncbi:MAG: cyclopropane-fatty-acyl-phospholipid synthase family protein [Bdellovibrionota bacterium]
MIKAASLFSKFFDSPSLGIMIVQQALRQMQYGSVTIKDRDHSIHVFKGKKPGPNPVITVYDWSGMRDIVKRGDIGTAEAYMQKKIDVEDIGEFINWACRNEKSLKKVIYGHSLSLIKEKVFHLLNRNSRRGSKKNIEFHYDLGNDFYSLWLDKTKAYSSALYKTGKETLEEAQIAKFDRIIEKLQPKAGAKVLEIGSGWGGFLERLMLNTKATYYGITLSSEQHEYCQELIAKNGWSDRARVEIIDYRDVHEKFDHVVSVEMVEAVGYEYWSSYIESIRNCLIKDGTGLIQAISIRADLFKDYLRGTDFIQQYIFPGGVLVNIPEFIGLMKQNNLMTQEIFSMRESYAETLKTWANNMRLVKEDVMKLGFDERFYRMWLFYFGYCEGAFLGERIDISQIYFKG